MLSFAASLGAPVLVAQAGVGVIYSAGGVAAVAGAPFTATLKTVHEQTLADGTRINRETIVKEACDSTGRIYRESQLQLPEDVAGTGFAVINIFDPVNHVSISWNTRGKLATITHWANPEEIHPDGGAEPTTALPARTPRIDPLPAPPQIERLGTQTIDGVSAEGTRFTRVIPAGRQGNDQPITITTETWRSKELNLVVRRIQDDPRTGLTTTDLTDLQQGEPDPSLFQVPDGYTVKEHYPQQPQN